MVCVIIKQKGVKTPELLHCAQISLPITIES